MVYNKNMKKIIFFGFILLFGLSVNFAFAQVFPMIGFGGRIITAPTPGVSCPAGKIGSPFTVAGVTGPSWLMVGDYYPTSLGFKLTPGAWILALYIPVPIPECQTQSVPPVPVTGYRNFLHGTSDYITN